MGIIWSIKKRIVTKLLKFNPNPIKKCRSNNQKVMYGSLILKRTFGNKSNPKMKSYSYKDLITLKLLIEI